VVDGEGGYRGIYDAWRAGLLDLPLTDVAPDRLHGDIRGAAGYTYGQPRGRVGPYIFFSIGAPGAAPPPPPRPRSRRGRED